MKTRPNRHDRRVTDIIKYYFIATDNRVLMEFLNSKDIPS